VNRWRTIGHVALVLLGGGLLALAWWDWAYPGLLPAMRRGERLFGYAWHRLIWALAIGEGVCLGVWWLSAAVQPDSRVERARASSPFGLALLILPALARYRLHPWGVQPGSSVWTYWLIAVTVGVFTVPLHRMGHGLGLFVLLRRWGRRIVWAAVAIYALVFCLLSLARYDAFRAHALDLGTMDQAAWNTVHGRVLERTPLYRDPADGSRYENRLLDAKLELILLPLSGLYWLWSDPRALLIVQSVFLAAGAIPLFGLLCDALPEALARASLSPSSPGRAGLPPGTVSAPPVSSVSLPAVLLTLAYLLYLPLHYVNMADFHPSALMVPLLIAAWRAMRRQRWGCYYLWLVLALCCRVDAAFVALGLGVAIAAAGDKGARSHGLSTLVLAIAWLAIDFGVIVPVVRQAYGPGAGDLVSRRFGALGDGPIDVLRTLVARPAFVLAQLADRDKVQVIFDLFVPVGYSSLLCPLALLPALPVLGINLLAESTWQNSIHAHYMAPVIPFIWIATGEAVAWLWKRRSSRWAGVLSLFCLLNTLLVAWAFSPFPPGRSFRLAERYQPSVYEEHLRSAMAHIPDGASVCAQSDLHPHLSQRRDAALFPRCRLGEGEEADYVIVDLDPASDKSPLGYHAFYELVGEWLHRAEYGVIAIEGGALLFCRGAPRDNLDDVLAALDAYGQGLYRVDFVSSKVRPQLRRDEYYRVPIVLRNTSTQTWPSGGQLPVRLSYRWLAEDGSPVLAVPALRTALPRRLAPGHRVRLRAELLTPSQPGTYTLEWDLLREGDAWFGDKGGQTLRQDVVIR
jgi:uncharacterized membrane protein